MIDTFFQWAGILAVGFAIIGLIDSRAAGVFGCSWLAWVQAKAGFFDIFKRSFTNRFGNEFPSASQTPLVTGSEN